jgi:opacity protein-like surface antigen
MKGIMPSATALAALAAAAPAFATEGWYGRIDGGFAFAGGIDTDFNRFLIDTDGDGFLDDEITLEDEGVLDDDMENGWLASIGAGYAFLGTGWRLEGEASYHSGETDGFDIFGFVPPVLGTTLDIFDSGTEANVWSLMVNGYYDFHWASNWSPYLGAGIGASNVSLEHTRVVDVVVATPVPVVVDTFAFRADHDEWVFSWQLMAGVAFPVSDQLAIDVGYRYFRADGAETNFIFEDNFVVNPAFGFTSDTDFDQHLVTAGLRWQFAPPAPPPAPYTPPPPPPPPSCPAEQFTAERGKDLSAAMDAAVAQARTCNYSGIVVSGPADRLPTVRNGLIERGVPASVISTQPSGAATGPVTISLN